MITGLDMDRFMAVSNFSPEEFTIDKFGVNPSITTATDPEDLWDAGGVYALPTTARLHDVASTSINDTSAGTGVRTVEVFGLSATWGLQKETVILNGVANVPTVNTYTSIFRIKALAAGSGGVAAGDITATAQTDSTITAQIMAGGSTTAMAIFMIPADYEASIVSVTGDVSQPTGAARTAEFQLLAQPFGGVRQLLHSFVADSTGSSHIPHIFQVEKYVPPKTLVVVSVKEVSNTVGVRGSFAVHCRKHRRSDL